MLDVSSPTRLQQDSNKVTARKVNETMKSKKEHIIPIHPWSELADSDYYVCNGCRKIARVVKLQYQTTGLYEQSNGERALSQKERELWLCADCREKIIDALSEVKTA